MSKNALETIQAIALDHVVGGAGETPSISDPTFRADVLGPCAVAAGAQAMLDQQAGRTPDAKQLTDVCAGAVGVRKVIKSIQTM